MGVVSYTLVQRETGTVATVCETTTVVLKKGRQHTIQKNVTSAVFNMSRTFGSCTYDVFYVCLGYTPNRVGQQNSAGCQGYMFTLASDRMPSKKIGLYSLGAFLRQ